MRSTAQPTSATQKAALWRERMARHGASGKTIAAYCQEHKLGKSTVSYWRHRLGEIRTAAKPAAGFVEVGAVKAVGSPWLLRATFPMQPHPASKYTSNWAAA